MYWIKYYFNAEAKERMDMLTHENGVTYDISLYDASSGMQSLVPMTVLMHYLTTDYFGNYGKDFSYEQEQKRVNLAWAVAREITTKYYPEEVKNEDYKTVYTRLIQEKSADNDSTAVSQMVEMKRLFEHLSKPKSISFILEEPEQNLFPQTQVYLFNDIVSICNGEHPSSVFMTTHSPYMLAAANILLFAGKLQSMGVSAEQLKELTGTDAFIPDGIFSAYSVSDGTCTSLLDSETNLINVNELDTASDYNAEVFDRLYKLYVKKLRDK